MPLLQYQSRVLSCQYYLLLLLVLLDDFLIKHG